ncbi:MAG: retroviral-like aspartic protease family protein [Calothrix sp. C42_A2020_038]|nr:retroviral-like aspartic protease family protein [Calothrix sp. C42_A2020_038]
MLDFNRIQDTANQEMAEVRVKVKLINAIDEELVNRGLLNPNNLRVFETVALVDTGAVRTVIPMEVVQQLGLRIRGKQTAKYADARQEEVGLTGPVFIEIEGRETTEAVLVARDEVLIGQTVLESLDLLVDCKNHRLIPNPKHPEHPVFRI